MSKRRGRTASSPSWVIPVVIAGALLVVGAILLPLLLESPQRSASASPEQIALGKEVYGINCAACHGLNGEGENPAAPLQRDANGELPAPPHDPTGHTWHHPDSQLLQIIRQGSFVQPTKVMPAYADKLSDEEIDAVLAYIKTFWGERELNYQAELTAKNP